MLALGIICKVSTYVPLQRTEAHCPFNCVLFAFYKPNKPSLNIASMNPHMLATHWQLKYRARGDCT